MKSFARTNPLGYHTSRAAYWSYNFEVKMHRRQPELWRGNKGLLTVHLICTSSLNKAGKHAKPERENGLNQIYLTTKLKTTSHLLHWHQRLLFALN
jgi:hypothetical protein